MDIKGVEVPKLCPDCHLAPEQKLTKSAFDDREVVEIRCERHGHVALGDTTEKAISHWNTYVDFVEQTRAEKGE